MGCQSPHQAVVDEGIKSITLHRNRIMRQMRVRTVADIISIEG
jgi:hypothetical protein